MSTRLYEFILAENGGDTETLQVKVWRDTPWITDAWVGEIQDGHIRDRERDMLLWCAEQFGEEAFPFGPTPRAGRWKRGGATVFGWAWFGFDTEEAMSAFLTAWPAPTSSQDQGEKK